MPNLLNQIFATRCLLIAVAHSDDIEFMFGGTLALLAERQRELGFSLVTMTFGSREQNTGEPLADTIKHQASAFRALGIEPLQRENYDFRARFLPDYEDEIRLALKNIKNRFDPFIVMTHYGRDPNQDHTSVHAQVMRVFSDRMIIGGEISNTGYHLEPNLFVGLEECHLVSKHKALSSYEAEAHKPYFQYSLIEGVARVRGAHSSRFEFAEAFELYRLHV